MAVLLDAQGNVYQGALTGGSLIRVAAVTGGTNLALSSSGAYALVTGKSAAGGSVAALISGLEQTASTHQALLNTLDVSTLPSILAGSVSDTGAAAIASGAGGPARIAAFPTGKPMVQVTQLGAFGGMQFVPNSDQLVLADNASGGFSSVAHVNAAALTIAALSTGAGIAGPVSLDLTSDGRWVVAANHAGDVLRVDLSGVQAASKVHCSCAPTEVRALNGAAVQLVTGSVGPLWTVDAGGATPRVFFIPAIASAPLVANASR